MSFRRKGVLLIVACTALLAACLPFKVEQVPGPQDGSATLNIVEATYTRTDTEDPTAALRIYCQFSHASGDDPIARPGEDNASHLHFFFGNTGADEDSTSSSIPTTGNSTCDGGIANRSTYWVPGMLFPDYEHDTPDDEFNVNAWFEGNDGPPSYNEENGPYGNTALNVYYKSGYDGVTAAQVDQWFPPGLKMLAGNPSANEVGENPHVGYGCVRQGNQAPVSTVPAIPECPLTITIDNVVYDTMIVMVITFPQCWDGVNLDSADHGAATGPSSHMRYAYDWNADGIHDQSQPSVFPTTGGGGWPDNGCPDGSTESTGRSTAGDPWIALPQITELVHYPRTWTQGDSEDWHLASDMYAYDDLSQPGGLSGHADFISGWDEEIGQRLIDHCYRGATGGEGWDCHGPLLGYNETSEQYEVLADNRGDDP